MDSDGLPLIGTGIDYTKCEAIYQKRTLAFLNHFITHTVRFLNKFSGVCEEKLETMSYRIQRLEIMMNILEAKLSSIPGLENVVAPTSGSSTTSPPVATTSDTPKAPEPTHQPSPAKVTSPEPAVPDVDPTPEERKMTVSQDPRYSKYFKMLSVGVPEPAVKNKMGAEGLDPSLLNRPDAPAPPGDAPVEPEEIGQDFSDSSGESDDFSD